MAAGAATWVAQTEGEVTPAAAGTPKSVLSVIAATGKTFKITELEVGFVGVNPVAKTVLVELLQSTQATAGTSSAVTPRRVNGPPAATVASTAAKIFTAEPTALTPCREWLVHPQIGLQRQFPLGREPEPDVAKALVLRVTFASGETLANLRAFIEFEE